jgi:hypothetical protein
MLGAILGFSSAAGFGANTVIATSDASRERELYRHPDVLQARIFFAVAAQQEIWKLGMFLGRRTFLALQE